MFNKLLIIKQLKKILYLVGGKKSKLLFFIFLFSLLSLFEVIGLGLIAPYIALVVDVNSIDNSSLQQVLYFFNLPHKGNNLLLVLGWVLLIIFVIKTFLVILMNKKIISFGQEQRANLSAFLMKSYQSLSYEEFLYRNSSEYIHNIHSLTSQFANLLILLLRAISNGIIGLFIILLLMWQNFVVLMVLLTIFAIMLFVYDVIFKGRVKKYGREANKASDSTLKGIHEGMEGFKEIRVLGKEEYFYSIVNNGVIKQALYNAKYHFLATIPRSLIELLMIVFIVSLVISAILTEQDLKMLIPTLGLFGIASLRLFPFIGTFSNILIELRHSHDSVSRLYNDVYKFRQKKYTDTVHDEEKKGSGFYDIEFDNVSFYYPKTDVQILNKISFKIKSGESIGIVGPSGSGKTTLIDLLMGLLNPSSGTIYYNGSPIIENLMQWRSHVAYIPQGIFLLDNTLKGNISWESESKVDNVKITKAIKQAQLSDLLKQLPNGLDTLLGERGMRVSGGQRQRIALARAFYNDRNVIIMDESTSALDNETEAEISNEIERLKGSKTLIVIAHRLTTLKNCDRIYRLENGRVTGETSYAELISAQEKRDK